MKAPFDGTIITAADSKHAIGIASADGMELLIHVGIDTVDMQGNGFTAKVKEGDTVTAAMYRSEALTLPLQKRFGGRKEFP